MLNLKMTIHILKKVYISVYFSLTSGEHGSTCILNKFAMNRHYMRFHKLNKRLCQECDKKLGLYFWFDPGLTHYPNIVLLLTGLTYVLCTLAIQYTLF